MNKKFTFEKYFFIRRREKCAILDQDKHNYKEILFYANILFNEMNKIHILHNII